MPSEFNISFQSRYNIYEKLIKCTIKDYEFNYSYNPTLIMSGSQGTVKDFVTGSIFTPYVTTVGFYNDAYELLAVAKFAKPIPLSQQTDTNILVRIDL